MHKRSVQIYGCNRGREWDYCQSGFSQHPFTAQAISHPHARPWPLLFMDFIYPDITNRSRRTKEISTFTITIVATYTVPIACMQGTQTFRLPQRTKSIRWFQWLVSESSFLAYCCHGQLTSVSSISVSTKPALGTLL